MFVCLFIYLVLCQFGVQVVLNMMEGFSFLWRIFIFLVTIHVLMSVKPFKRLVYFNHRLYTEPVYRWLFVFPHMHAYTLSFVPKLDR